MKYEWRKQDKALYHVSNKPVTLTVPSQNYITISGKGNPNNEEFAEKISVLYSLSFQVKSVYKTQCAHNPEISAQSGYDDYAVFPLEGLWTSTSTDPLEKDAFLYTIMIRQPDFITEEMFKTALALTEKKKPHPFLKEASFETIEDGECVEMLHTGSYDSEPASFVQMDLFVAAQGKKRTSIRHREIYLTDARKTPPEKKKTILRYQISN